MLEALMKWEDKLLGCKFTLVTDHTVADCLSHDYENDMSEDNHSENTYVNADIRLDPDDELLPTDCYMELCAAATMAVKATRQMTRVLSY